MTISLAFLAPDLVKAAIEGKLPHGMGLVRLCDLPVEWPRQHQALGLASLISASIEPVSALVPSLLPGNRISRPETKAPKRPLKSSCPFAETDRSQQMPPIRGYLPIVGKSLLVADCVVADVVVVEPVSGAKFPANREKNREFCQIQPSAANLSVNNRANSDRCREIPYAEEQGIISAEQGILAQ